MIWNCWSRERCLDDCNSFVSEQLTTSRKALYCLVMFSVLRVFSSNIKLPLIAFTGEKRSGVVMTEDGAKFNVE